jgi:hypothetical protein
MITRPKISSVLPSQVPEFVREDYGTFIEFIKAYYEFLDQNYDSQFTTLRDLDKTLDSFIEHFKNEVAHNIPYTVVNERFLLSKMKDQYLAKGSEASFKLLFKILFNKEVVVDYPSRQILRASDGKWNQDVSVFVYVNAGDPEDIVGKIVDVVTATKILRIQVDKRQYVEIEVENSFQISEHIYELFIDRRFFGNITIGDKLRYSNIFDATVLATTSKVEIQRAGKKFKVGELYEVRNGQGVGSVLKVTRVNETGGIESLEFVKYGIGYTTDFTATLLPYGGVSATSAGATGLVISGSSPNTAIAFAETLNGFFEQGTINTTNYNVTSYWDGTYVGETVREFFVDNKYTILDADEPAVIKVTLNSLAKYPGYYTTNDGFLDDAIFIQDSRYYQAFAYVLKIDERLDTYRSAVKTLLHPAGMALFGEFDIRNEFDTGTLLEFALKYLILAAQDEVQTDDAISTKGVSKPLATHLLNDGVTADTSSVTMSSETGTNSTRTVPFLVTTKAIASHFLNNGVTADSNTVTMSSETGTNSTRTVPYADISKPLATHFLNNGTTADTSSATPSEATISYGYSSLTRNGISVLTNTKILNSQVYNHYLYDGVTLDSDLFTLSDTTGSNSTRTVPYAEIEKPLATHLLNDGVTADTSSVTMSSETGTNSTRTVPFVVLNKSLATHYLNDGTTADTSSVTATGSGGGIWLNSYNDPYPISSSYFANDSGNYIVGESTFTG